MEKKGGIFGKTLWCVVITLSGYMIYTGDDRYLNVVTAYFGVYISLISLLYGLLFLVSCMKSNFPERDKVIKTMRDNTTIWYVVRSITNLGILMLLQYEWLLGLYLLITIITYGIISKGKEL